MTLQKNDTWLATHGYKIVGMYYNKSGNKLVCWQGNGEYLLRFIPHGRGSMFTKVYTDKTEANGHMRKLIIPGVEHKNFNDGLYVHDRKAEKLFMKN